MSTTIKAALGTLLLLVAAPFCPAQEDGPRLEVRLIRNLPSLAVPEAWGWTSFRLRLTNHTTVPQECDLEYESVDDNRRHAHEIRKRCVVGPGEETVVEMAVPWLYGTVRVTCPALPDPWEEPFTPAMSYESPLTLTVVKEGTLATWPERMDGPVPKHVGQSAILRAEDVPLSTVPLVGLPAIALDGDVFTTLQPAQQRALTDYARSGGHLLLLGGRAEMVLGASATPGLSRNSLRLGFGQVSFPRTRAHLLDRSFRLTPPGVGFRHGRMRSRLEVPGLTEVPVGTFTVLVIIFALLVGPVNLYVLGRKKRQPLALFTIPVISVAAALALVLWALADEGLQTKVTARSFTVLDQVRNEASIWSRNGYFSNLPPSRGLRFSPRTQAFFTSAAGTGRGITEHGEELVLTGAWLPAREASEIFLIRHEKRRERLLVREEADGMRVENALGVRVERVLIRRRDGRFLGAEGIDAGASVLAAPGDDTLLDPRDEQESALLASFSAWAPATSPLELCPTGRLEPGHYLALCRSAPPFVETGLADVVSTGDYHLVHGRWEGAAR